MSIVNPKESHYQVWDGDMFEYNMNNDIMKKDVLGPIEGGENLFIRNDFPSQVNILSNGMCHAQFLANVTGNIAVGDILCTLPVYSQARVFFPIFANADVYEFAVGELTGNKIITYSAISLASPQTVIAISGLYFVPKLTPPSQ
jgi:hypothetical protein